MNCSNAEIFKIFQNYRRTVKRVQKHMFDDVKFVKLAQNVNNKNNNDNNSQTQSEFNTRNKEFVSKLLTSPSKLSSAAAHIKLSNISFNPNVHYAFKMSNASATMDSLAADDLPLKHLSMDEMKDQQKSVSVIVDNGLNYVRFGVQLRREIPAGVKFNINTGISLYMGTNDMDVVDITNDNAAESSGRPIEKFALVPIFGNRENVIPIDEVDDSCNIIPLMCVLDGSANGSTVWIQGTTTGTVRRFQVIFWAIECNKINKICTSDSLTADKYFRNRDSFKEDRLVVNFKTICDFEAMKFESDTIQIPVKSLTTTHNDIIKLRLPKKKKNNKKKDGIITFVNRRREGFNGETINVFGFFTSDIQFPPIVVRNKDANLSNSAQLKSLTENNFCVVKLLHPVPLKCGISRINLNDTEGDITHLEEFDPRIDVLINTTLFSGSHAYLPNYKDVKKCLNSLKKRAIKWKDPSASASGKPFDIYKFQNKLKDLKIKIDAFDENKKIGVCIDDDKNDDFCDETKNLNSDETTDKNNNDRDEDDREIRKRKISVSIAGCSEELKSCEPVEKKQKTEANGEERKINIALKTIKYTQFIPPAMQKSDSKAAIIATQLYCLQCTDQIKMNEICKSFNRENEHYKSVTKLLEHFASVRFKNEMPVEISLKQRRTLVKAIIYIVEFLADVPPRHLLKITNLLTLDENKPTYMKIIEQILENWEKSTFYTIWPFYALKSQYLKYRVAPHDQEEQEFIIEKRFKSNPYEILKYMFDLSEHNKPNDTDDSKNSTKKNKLKLQFDPQLTYEVYHGKIKFDEMQRNIWEHNGKKFVVETINFMLFDVLGRIDENSNVSFIQSKTWTERLGLINSQLKVNIETKNGYELNEFVCSRQEQTYLTIEYTTKNGVYTRCSHIIPKRTKREAISSAK